MVAKDDPAIQPNMNAARDLTNCSVGIVWQLTLVTIPLYLVFRDLRGTLISLAVLAVTTVFLRKFWYLNLESGEGLTQVGDSLPVAPQAIAEWAGD
jgi:SSS family solute:Na+ symporter